MNCNAIFDFSECLQERCGHYQIRAVIPLVYVGISMLILLSTCTYTLLQSIYQTYGLLTNIARSLATSDDESLDTDEGVPDSENDNDASNSESTLIESLPRDTKVLVIEDRPSYERIWVFAEISLLLGQVALSIFAIIEGEGWRIVVVAGHVQWVYLLIIALLRLMGTHRTRRLWSHSTLIYLFSWPIAFLLLRSAILGQQKLDLGIQIANICLVTGLCALVLTSRAGNKAVKLVSTNGLEPTRVCLLRNSVNHRNRALVYCPWRCLYGLIQ